MFFCRRAAAVSNQNIKAQLENTRQQLNTASSVEGQKTIFLEEKRTELATLSNQRDQLVEEVKVASETMPVVARQYDSTNFDAFDSICLQDVVATTDESQKNYKSNFATDSAQAESANFESFKNNDTGVVNNTSDAFASVDENTYDDPFAGFEDSNLETYSSAFGGFDSVEIVNEEQEVSSVDEHQKAIADSAAGFGFDDIYEKDEHLKNEDLSNNNDDEFQVEAAARDDDFQAVKDVTGENFEFEVVERGDYGSPTGSLSSASASNILKDAVDSQDKSSDRLTNFDQTSGGSEIQPTENAASHGADKAFDAFGNSVFSNEEVFGENQYEAREKIAFGENDVAFDSRAQADPFGGEVGFGDASAFDAFGATESNFDAFGSAATDSPFDPFASTDRKSDGFDAFADFN